MNYMPEKEKLTKAGKNALIAPYRWWIAWTIVFFISAWRLDIPRAWLYVLIVLIGNIINTLVLLKYMRELYNLRGGAQEGTKKWDYFFLLIYFFTSLILVPLVAGFDVGRFQWSYLDFHFMIIGIILYILSFALVLWAMLVNQHFEGTVRIQEDRGHKVVSTGPYKIVRHPGYVGMILGSFSPSFIVGSFFSLIPVVVIIITVIFRTHFEDKLLRAELEGYLDYANKTKYRLIPGIW